MKGYHQFKGYSLKTDYDEATGKFVDCTVDLPGFGQVPPHEDGGPENSAHEDLSLVRRDATCCDNVDALRLTVALPANELQSKPKGAKG